MERERLTFWEILFEGLKKFAGEIIGALLLAVFLYCFPGLRSLITDYVFPKNDEAQTEIQRELELHRREEERLKKELRRKEEALRKAEEARHKTEPAPTPKRPAISDNDFVELCGSGNVQKVKEAIMNGANVNAKIDYGDTAFNYGVTGLMSAAMKGDTETAELLLKHGADVNKDGYDMTALMHATFYGHTEIAELLLKYGANINAKDWEGNTALMYAIRE
ncbi:MAG: ankyrin repeat domain-containing protein [Synergistaceae bacterium]|nr:ankyrin repeat domain-containing protein [Synergistaceae bacterium]